MRACVAAGASFLISVLWFDLMFDVQVWGYGSTSVPHDTLASIAAYYRRVTIDASPMGYLVAVVMLATLIAIVVEIRTKATERWVAWASFALALSAILLGRFRALPNAAALGRGMDDAAGSQLAQMLLYDHLYAIVAMTIVLILQLAIRSKARV